MDWAALSLDGAVEQLGLVACETAFEIFVYEHFTQLIMGTENSVNVFSRIFIFKQSPGQVEVPVNSWTCGKSGLGR